jgi:hypothetical protein
VIPCSFHQVPPEDYAELQALVQQPIECLTARGHSDPESVLAVLRYL